MRPSNFFLGHVCSVLSYGISARDWVFTRASMAFLMLWRGKKPGEELCRRQSQWQACTACTATGFSPFRNAYELS